MYLSYSIGISADSAIILGDANNSPYINITTSGSKFLVSTTTSSTTTTRPGGGGQASGDYCHPKTIVGKGAITINNGIINASCTSGDAIDSNGNIAMSGGAVIANGPQSGAEEACDFNGTFKMSGGFFIGAGSNSNMTKAMSTSSTQRNLYLKSSSVIASSSLLNIQDASGNEIITFKPKYGGYYYLFSSPALTSDVSYSIYTGGTYIGGTSNNGLYSGGVYSGGTFKKSTTLSGIVTTISF